MLFTFLNEIRGYRFPLSCWLQSSAWNGEGHVVTCSDPHKVWITANVTVSQSGVLLLYSAAVQLRSTEPCRCKCESLLYLV